MDRTQRCRIRPNRCTLLQGEGYVASLALLPCFEVDTVPGIWISNTPGAVDDATATTALYLIISALRCYSRAERTLRTGGWKSSHKAGEAHDLTGRTLAILGLGGIGLRLAELAHAFPMRVVYHNRTRNASAPAWCEYYGPERLDELLAQADVLSVHVPLKDDTVGFVGETMIRKLKRGTVLVNTARGKVVDEAAMIRALEDGHVRHLFPVLSYHH